MSRIVWGICFNDKFQPGSHARPPEPEPLREGPGKLDVLQGFQEIFITRRVWKPSGQTPSFYKPSSKPSREALWLPKVTQQLFSRVSREPPALGPATCRRKAGKKSQFSSTCHRLRSGLDHSAVKAKTSWCRGLCWVLACVCCCSALRQCPAQPVASSCKG